MVSTGLRPPDAEVSGMDEAPNKPGGPSSVYRRFTDPLDVKSTGNVVEYSWYPAGPVRHCEIHLGNRFMGWLWADDSADAA